MSHSPQPSVGVVEPCLTDFWPEGQFMSRHSFAMPPGDYLPLPHTVQPSRIAIEPVLAAI